VSAVTIRAREELEVEPPPSTSTATPNRWFSSFPSFGTWQPRRAAAAAPTPGHIPPSATAAASAAAAGALPSAMPVPTKPLRSGRKIQSVGNSLDHMGEDLPAGKRHLVVLVNGVAGYSTDWDELCAQARRSEALGHMWFHASAANGGSKTFDGIDVCGDRLVAELRGLVAAGASLTHITFVGHSMGGLISRYAIGRLFSPGDGTLLGLQPAHYITMATPHLGCDGFGVSQVPLLGWARGVPLIGDSIQRAMVAAAAPVTAVMFGKSGHQLWLQDGPQPPASRPLIERLATDDAAEGPFLSGLAAFRTRTAYANVAGDHLVGWANSSLRFAHQLPPVESLREVVNIRSYGIGDGCAAPEAAGPTQLAPRDVGLRSRSSSRSSGANGTEPSPAAGIELEEFKAPGGAQQGPHGAAPSQALSTMLLKLQNLEWRRVDVWIRDPISHFMAHNHIQVTSKWANGVGRPIITHLLDHLARLDGKEARPWAGPVEADGAEEKEAAAQGRA